jgi:peptidoglycan/LPS O-acetylase OafA/YrhL
LGQGQKNRRLIRRLIAARNRDRLEVGEMTSRNQSLDVLRGIAVLMVVGHHFPYYIFWAQFGGMGVDLFFVLSGYLISGLLFAEYQRSGTISISRFLIRRGFKIYPAYYAMVPVFLPFTWHTVKLADFTLMGSYFPDLWGHAWSLSVEEHFYIVLPILFVFAIRFSRNFNWIPWMMLSLAVACLLLRYRFAMTHSVTEGIAQTHLRMDALFAGVTLR